jgi:hypothetical protein
MEINNNAIIANYPEPFDFGIALVGLKNGKKLQRKGWNGKGLYVAEQVPDENSANTLPYLYIVYPAFDRKIGSPDYPDGARVPWLASQTDILAEDWQEFPAQ